MRIQRRLIKAISVSFVAAVALLALPQPAQAAPLSFDKPLHFFFVHSGRCLDVLGFRTDDGAPVGQWTCNGLSNQSWVLRAVGPSGLYEVRSSYSGKCLDALGFRTESGAPVGQWTCNGLSNQQWRVHYVDPRLGTETLVLINNYSGNCLDMPGPSMANGTRADQVFCHMLYNQQLHPYNTS
jgi:ricin-type beta-trefoil lectin protein